MKQNQPAQTQIPEAPDPTIQTLSKMKGTIENLTKRNSLLETKMKNELRKAMEFKKSKKTADALLCLKRKKLYEEEVKRLTASLFNLEHQVMTLESSQTAKEMVNSQQEYKKAMERIQQKVNADDVAELQDDIQEQMEIYNEVNEILAETNNDELDDVALENELDELLAEDELAKVPVDGSANSSEHAQLEAELNNIMQQETNDSEAHSASHVQPTAQPANPISAGELNFPAAPTQKVAVSTTNHTKPTEAEADDVQALRELAAEMAM